MRDNFFFYNCPTEKSTSKSIFKEIEWKSYFIQKQGCPLPNGNECTYEKAKTLCQTVFGYGIGGKLLQPTTLQINNAVLKTAEDTFCCNYFWIGVSNMDYRYLSNNKSVSIESIPWHKGQPIESDKSYCLLAGSASMKWFPESLCSWTYGWVIGEKSFW